MSEPMSIDSSSQHSSLASGGNSGANSGAEGAIPLPEDSPFLSDHGLGVPAPPPTGRVAVLPPAGVSQFPPPSALRGSPSHYGVPPRPSNEAEAGPAMAPQIPTQDDLSSFAIFGGHEDPGFGARGGPSASRSAASEANAEILERLKHIQISTTDSLQGRLVELYLGVVTAEALVPTDILLEGAERTGHFSRYKSSQQKLKSLEQLVVAELKLEADKLGGNAVVGASIRVSMDHGVVLIAATGTAVRLV